MSSARGRSSSVIGAWRGTRARTGKLRRGLASYNKNKEEDRGSRRRKAMDDDDDKGYSRWCPSRPREHAHHTSTRQCRGIRRWLAQMVSRKTMKSVCEGASRDIRDVRVKARIASASGKSRTRAGRACAGTARGTDTSARARGGRIYCRAGKKISTREGRGERCHVRLYPGTDCRRYRH